MFSKYYSKIFIPFISNIFKANRLYYYLIPFVFMPIVSYYNLINKDISYLSLNLILTSIVFMLLIYSFALSMLLQNEDKNFSEGKVSVQSLNFWSSLFIIVYFISYFIGLLLIKKTFLGDYSVPLTCLSYIPSLFFGLAIANDSIYKYRNQNANKVTINSFVKMGLLVLLYLITFFYVPANISIFILLTLIVLSVLVYVKSVVFFGKKSYAN